MTWLPALLISFPDVLDGYNGTVFAYGQTGSGKTFTMMVRRGGLGTEAICSHISPGRGHRLARAQGYHTSDNGTDLPVDR